IAQNKSISLDIIALFNKILKTNATVLLHFFHFIILLILYIFCVFYRLFIYERKAKKYTAIF
ncbi:hypothetical protein, partial [Anaerotignum sp.]|uniref:hypothetical protein n=1 Tax=Anaerotignum sp. TaxID=2039241 RepID=UPI00373519CD